MLVQWTKNLQLYIYIYIFIYIYIYIFLYKNTASLDLISCSSDIFFLYEK